MSSFFLEKSVIKVGEQRQAGLSAAPFFRDRPGGRKACCVSSRRPRRIFRYQRQRAKLHQPVDRNEWWITPQTVDALNLPLQNALNFPAAILQPPYFDP